MPNFLTIASAVLLLGTIGCTDSAGNLKEPPVLKVTSPERSLIQSGAGELMVTGTATPNESGTAVDKVFVNGVQATLEADGQFKALIEIGDGASLIKTVARDADGTEVSDTRAVQAGELRSSGAIIDDAVTATLSAETFATLSAAAGPLIESLDIGALIAPLQPVVDVGPSCAFAQLFVDDVTFSDVRVNLAPAQGGLSLTVEVTGLDVRGRARYGVLCASFTTGLRATASRIVVGGTLLVRPVGSGFKTDLTNQRVTLQGLSLHVGGIPPSILDLLDVTDAIEGLLPVVARLAMEPVLNRALGGLSGPKQLDVLGKQITMQVTPSVLDFTSQGALVTMNMSLKLGGAEGSQFIFTDNGLPATDPETGFALGLADDLANEMLAQAHRTGVLELAMDTPAGTFDKTDVVMSLPPMISADATGAMRVVLGDMIATFRSQGTPVGKAAINASVDLALEPVNNGFAVAVRLGTPVIAVNVLDDIANATLFEDQDLSRAVEATLGAQINSVSLLLAGIPLPALGGIQMRNLSLGADDGYVMIKGTLE